MIFVNSMSDLFHEDVPDEFIAQVFWVMAQAQRHTFQVLTKRAERLAAWHARNPSTWWLANVWLGVSVENRQHGVARIPYLRRVRAAVRFLSVEPLLEDVGALNLDGVDWVIVGGESGHGARPMRSEWAISVRDQCLAAGVPFFFKQWGGVWKKRNGRELECRTWNELPSVRRTADATLGAV
jgi:protein gp37